MSEKFSVDKLNCLVELHLHLDGAISISSARKLAKLQGISLPESDEELWNMLSVPDGCQDLNEFLTKFDLPCSLLQTKEGIEMAVKNLLEELKDQGVMYAEIRFAPQFLTGKGLSQEEIVGAAIEAALSSPIPCGFILCCMRFDNNHEANLETIRVAKKYLGKGVVAADLAGAEGLFPTYRFSDIFEYAKTLGVPFVIHAGEADGPRSIKDAISFGAKRIGHGVRCLEDMDLAKEIALKRIPLELCPSSNICTAIFKDMSEYPLTKLMDLGINITINTDDSTVVGTSLKKEYQKLIDTFNIGKSDVREFLINAARGSFADEDTKEKLIAEIKNELA